MKKFHFLTILALLTFSMSCKKEKTSTPAAVKFMSFTAGSTWNYKVTNNPSAPTPTTSTYTLTATTQDSVANGKTYTIFTHSAGANEYYNITGSDYYTYRALPASFGGGSIEVLYLKDNLALDGTWSQTSAINVSGIAITVTVNNKISGKGLSKTVNGINYSDVTEVTTTLAGFPPGVTVTSDIKYYYAPKFGQIESRTKIDLNAFGTTSSFDQKTELQSATIL
jgi:hypothetical protein